MVKIRILSQTFWLIFFGLYSIMPRNFKWAEILFQMDLASMGSYYLSMRDLSWVGLWCVGLLVITLVYGRVFCGWMCPMGTLVDMIDKVIGAKSKYYPLRKIKYYLLFVFFITALGGVSTVWVLDPMNIASRLLSTLSALKVVDLETAFLLFLFIVALEKFLGRRAFCRILCPLGGMLAFISRYSFYQRKLDSSCTYCTLCTKGCKMMAIGDNPADYNRQECIQCHDCQSSCHPDSIEYSYFKKRKHKTNPKRRAQLASLAALLLVKLPSAKASSSSSKPLRPPGTVPEEDFKNKCIRCGACIRACPTHTLVPEEGFGSFWLQTPVFDPDLGGCSPSCNDCGVVCPTQAILPLPLEEKNKVKIGLAVFDSTSCLPLGQDKACVVCFASCPFDAIGLTESTKNLPWGEKLLKPYIKEQDCTGCALCQVACPVTPKAAVTVSPVKNSVTPV